MTFVIVDTPLKQSFGISVTLPKSLMVCILVLLKEPVPSDVRLGRFKS